MVTESGAVEETESSKCQLSACNMSYYCDTALLFLSDGEDSSLFVKRSIIVKSQYSLLSNIQTSPPSSSKLDCILYEAGED